MSPLHILTFEMSTKEIERILDYIMASNGPVTKVTLLTIATEAII